MTPGAMAEARRVYEECADDACSQIRSERIIAAALDGAALAERARIVAFLRAEADRCAQAFHECRSEQAGVVAVGLRARADAIERGAA